MSLDDKQIQEQRKAARKTALVLALVALGFFSWAVYTVVTHAT